MKDNDNRRQPTSEPSQQTIAITTEGRFRVRLRERRDALGWSQRHLAQKLLEVTGLKLDASAITRIEQGERKITLTEAYSLASVLGTDINSMIRLENPTLDHLIRQAQLARENALQAIDYWNAEMKRSEQNELRWREYKQQENSQKDGD